MKARKRGGVANSLLYILLFPVYLLGKLFPRDKHLLAFGSGHGNFFMDNSKYFFLYCAKNLTDRRCVFFSRDIEVVRQLSDSGYESCYTNSWKGFITALRAGKCFISHSTHDINALLMGGAEIIQLWHGTPLKLVCYDVLPLAVGFKQKLKNTLRKVLFGTFPYLNTGLVYDKIVISSDFVKPSFKSGFRAADNQLIIAGQPRNDALSEDYCFDRTIFPEIEYLDRTREEFRHIITWMPTHRLRSGRGTVGLLEDFGFDLNNFANALKRQKALLVVKVHFLDSSALKERFAGCESIRIYEYPDPYPLLRYTDILISDYSSVFFDFLLRNRPVIFTPFDREEYIRTDAPFYYDYESVTPGRRCADWPEVLQSLNYHIGCRDRGEEDSFSAERSLVGRKFNAFSEGYSERAAKEILS